MTRDEQEALSRLYSDDIIRLLPLSSGAVAVFNNARDLCGILPPSRVAGIRSLIDEVFYRPRPQPPVDLDDLGLT